MSLFIESYVRDTIAKLEEAIIQLDACTIDACNEIANVSVELLSKNAPYDEAENNGVLPDEAGHLNESFLAIEGISITEGEGQASVETIEPIKLEYVTEGTEDHTPIIPLVKKALWWPELDHPVAWVSGQEPNPFVEETMVQIQDLVPIIVEEEFAPAFDILRNL